MAGDVEVNPGPQCSSSLAGLTPPVAGLPPLLARLSPLLTGLTPLPTGLIPLLAGPSPLLAAVWVYNIFLGQALSSRQEFVKNNSSRLTRAGFRGDCRVPFRKSAFRQSIFSFHASQTWNSIPCVILQLPHLTSFTKHLKAWLLENQNCDHNSVISLSIDGAWSWRPCVICFKWVDEGFVQHSHV